MNNYRIEQSERYVGNDYWTWSAWIEGADSDLDRIAQVVWVLHPTFKEPRVTINDRSSKFRLDTAGWGTFLLRAEVHVGDEKDMRVLRHVLRLTHPEEPGGSAETLEAAKSSDGPDRPAARPRLFLSYASEDADRARTLRRTIEDLGADVVDASTIVSGMPIRPSLRKLIRESDAVVGLFGSSYASPWVLDELRAAESDEKPIVALAQEELSLAKGVRADVMHVGLDEAKTAAVLSDFVAKLNAR